MTLSIESKVSHQLIPNVQVPKLYEQLILTTVITWPGYFCASAGMYSR